MSDYMPPVEPIEPEKPPFEPSAVQLARASALRRYNWLSTFLPLILLALVVLGTAVWLIWATTINEELATARIEFVSSLADLIIILSVLPMIVACLLLPIAGIALMVYDRKREMTRIAYLQRLIWRGDAMVETVRHKVEETSPKVAQPVIRFNSSYAYMVRILQRLRSILLP